MRLYGALAADKTVEGYAREIAQEYASYAAVIKQYVLRDGGLRYRLEGAFRAGKSIIGEGAHGTMLDIIHGTKRFQTSSATTAGAWQAATGFPLARFEKIVGVFKVYDTRVGGGPFPTELADQKIAESRRRGDQMTPEEIAAFQAGDPVAVSKYIQIKGDEFGATSGRGRRVGWHDLVTARYDCLLNNFTEAAITRLDTIADVDLQVCEAYRTADGRVIQEVPEDLSTVQPVYMNRTFFWSQSAFEGNNLQKMIDEGWKALPKEVKEFISIFCQYTDTPVSMFGVGKETEAIVTKDVMLETMGIISKQRRDEIIAWKEMARKVCEPHR
jgi:adenylosuccinate synthase